MPRTWTSKDVLEVSWGFQKSCVLTAAAQLNVFTHLAESAKTAAELAEAIGGDLRGTTVLADALAAMEMLVKTDRRYALADGIAETLTADGSDCVLYLVQHHHACLRRWARLPWVVRDGEPADVGPGVRGVDGDRESFIRAMHDISRWSAGPLIAELGPPAFSHLLDVGGGSGTWTAAFLHAREHARATIFDLPKVVPMAEARMAEEGLADRVDVVGGDLFTDELPAGADLAWVCAIIHMLSRAQCRDLYAKVHRALADGGRILIRDVVMDDDHVHPAGGALFAVNMLSGNAGGTYSFTEIADDLRACGFADVTQRKESEFMDGVVEAIKA